MKNLLYMVIIALLTGCMGHQPGQVGMGRGAYYTPVVDGVKDDAYYKNLRECRQLAGEVEQQQKAQSANNAITGAVVSGVVGALLGASIGDSGDAAIGGATGAVVGGAGTALQGNVKAANSGKTIIVRCMRGRGHNVLL